MERIAIVVDSESRYNKIKLYLSQAVQKSIFHSNEQCHDIILLILLKII